MRFRIEEWKTPANDLTRSTLWKRSAELFLVVVVVVVVVVVGHGKDTCILTHAPIERSHDVECDFMEYVENCVE